MNTHYVLYNHHDGKPTIIIGELCCNGCQVFHKDDAMGVFEDFLVSDQHQNDVFDHFAKYNPNEPFDFASFINDPVFDILNSDQFIYTNTSDLILKVIEYYYSYGCDLGDLLFNSRYDEFIAAGVKLYTKNQLDTLVNKSGTIRAGVASIGHKDHLDIFVKDPLDLVRLEVAKHGYHLDKLVSDPYWRVRFEVAKHGYGLDILVNDLEWIIRLEVTKRCNKKLLDILVNDIADLVRAEVAKRGNKKHLDVLVNDRNYEVLCKVLKAGNKTHLSKLSKNLNPFIANEAKRRLNSVYNLCNVV